MKISVVSIFLAFAEFLQESKCMNPSGPDVKRGTAVATLQNGGELRGDFFTAQEQPSWLQTRPTQKFEHYDVFFHATLIGHYKARLYRPPTVPLGQVPQSVATTLGNLEYLPFESLVKYRPGTVINMINAVDHVFITIPGTKEIYLQKLITKEAYEEQKQMEEYKREMREKRPKNSAGPSSKNWAWGYN